MKVIITDELSKNKKNKKKRKNKKYYINSRNTYNIEGYNKNTRDLDTMIYFTESPTTHLTYKKTGRTKGERDGDKRAKNLALKRSIEKKKENQKRYRALIEIIGDKECLENIYSSYFKNDIDTLDFIDQVDDLIYKKNVSESDLVFIREYLYKTLNSAN